MSDLVENQSFFSCSFVLSKFVFTIYVSDRCVLYSVLMVQN